MPELSKQHLEGSYRFAVHPQAGPLMTGTQPI